MTSPRIVIYRTLSPRRSQRWAWRLVARNGRIVASSGEGYRHRSDAESMALMVARGEYRDAVVVAS